MRAFITPSRPPGPNGIVILRTLFDLLNQGAYDFVFDEVTAKHIEGLPAGSLVVRPGEPLQLGPSYRDR